MEDWLETIMTDDDKVDAYNELRRRAGYMGYSTIGDALDALRRQESQIDDGEDY